MITLEQLSRVGIGTSRAASLGSRMALAAFAGLLKIAAEHGVNLIDTADFYGSGDAERLIARSLKKTVTHFLSSPRPGCRACTPRPGCRR